MVESPPADAGHTGSCPSAGGSRVLQSGWAREPWPLGLCIRSLCSAMGEATMMRGPRTAKKEKNLQTVNAGEGVEKREPSCTVGGNVN